MPIAFNVVCVCSLHLSQRSGFLFDLWMCVLFGDRFTWHLAARRRRARPSPSSKQTNKQRQSAHSTRSSHDGGMGSSLPVCVVKIRDFVRSSITLPCTIESSNQTRETTHERPRLTTRASAESVRSDAGRRQPR
jgi:hypothetical protein